jgi:hypothetical protein
VGRDVANNRFTNARNQTLRSDCLNRDVQAFESALSHAFGLRVNVSDQKRLGLIAVPTLDNGRQINIGNITGFQLVITRNSVTNHIIDTDTTAFGKRVFVSRISKTGRRMAMIEGVLVNQRIEPGGRDAGLNVGSNEVHQLRVESARLAHHIALSFRKSVFGASSNLGELLSTFYFF